jgi:hypothetical protein
MIVYIDESGDLGWKLDQPYRNGGSSKYLTIGFLIVPNEKSHIPKRIIRRFYNKFHIPRSIEWKGKDLTIPQREYFIKETKEILRKHRDIRVLTITVMKENVQPHIRADQNKLYNYMVRLALLDEIKNEPIVNFIPDPRTIKISSGSSLIDYLQTELYFELSSATKLNQILVDSKSSLNLQFIDFISHIIWKSYEDNDKNISSGILHVMKQKTLFFH